MRRILSLAALSLLVASTASAQRASTAGSPTPIEFGADGTLNFGLGGTSSATVFDLPMSRARVGFFVAPEWSIEPFFGFRHVSQGGDASSNLVLGAGALYHFSTSRTQNQVYVRPFLDFIDSRVTITTGAGTKVTTSSNLYELGAGLGVKIPWRDRLSWRLEANISHNSKQYIDNSDNRLGLLFGLSYFTH